MAQIIGRSCATRVAALTVTGQPGAYENRIAGYTSYHRGVLWSIILINTAIANVSDSTKNSLAIGLLLPDFSGQTLYLSYLTVDGADAKHGATWNGTSYENRGDGSPAVVDDTVHTVIVSSNGTAMVMLRDSQAVVANMGSYVGAHAANQTACAVLTRPR
jgi:hypothetical protein